MGSVCGVGEQVAGCNGYAFGKRISAQFKSAYAERLTSDAASEKNERRILGVRRSC